MRPLGIRSTCKETEKQKFHEKKTVTCVTHKNGDNLSPGCKQEESNGSMCDTEGSKHDRSELHLKGFSNQPEEKRQR
jgi:hypothetical protein